MTQLKRPVCLLFALLCLAITGCAATQDISQTSEITETSPTPALTPTPTPTPTPEPMPARVDFGTQGEDVEKLQTRLSELGYYLSSETAGEYGERTKVAVSVFQRENGLPRTGIADEETCALLFGEDAVPCPDFSTWAPTVNMSFEELVGDDGLREFPAGYPASDTYYIIVDIEHQVVMVYAKDEAGEYTIPVRYMLCSTGLGNRTPLGTFALDTYKLRFSKFVRDGRYGQYWTQIRKAIYFHTTLYTYGDVNSYEEQTYLELGQKASHGCVRLTIPDARWMWYNAGYGTTCEIRLGDPADMETQMIREQLVLPDPPQERITLSPETLPNTDNWRIEDVPIEIPYVQGSQD